MSFIGIVYSWFWFCHCFT